jgi:hypothetical protein
MNGKNPTAESPRVTIKVIPYRRGKSEYDVLPATANATRSHIPGYPRAFWTGTSRTQAQGARTLMAAVDDKFEWDGRGDDGLSPDGPYTYSLKATDQAGNTAHPRRSLPNRHGEETGPVH